MSWGGVILRAPYGLAMANLPGEFVVRPLGSSDFVRGILEQLFPDQTHVDSQSWICGEYFWLELNYGHDVSPAGTIDSISVRSNAENGAIHALKSVCDALDARLFDNQTGEFADFADNTRSSLREFVDFRDRNM